MKKTLSSVVSIALISSMFATAAFAAETTSTPETTNTSVSATKEMTTLEKYEALKAAGVFEGDSTGANLEGLTDRAQIAKIIAKAFELSENASGASVYNDEAFKTPEYSWSLGFVGAVTKAGLMDGVWEGVFDPTSNVTHEQIATILVKAFKLEHPATAEVEGEVSDWAKGYVAAAVKAGLIKAQADYTVAAKRSDLVESAWTAIEKIEAEKPVTALKVSGVTALTNNKVSIALSEAVTAVDKSKISVKNFDGTALEVTGATLSADGKTVTVTTAAQTAYAAYALTADGVTKNFVGLPVDTTKPAITSSGAVIGADAVVTVVFNEAVDAATATNVANYTLNNNLTVTSAELQTDGVTVKLTTSAQTVGTLYTLTVQNVADLAGNIMDKKDNLYFGGIVDTTKPTATVAVNADATVTVTFNEEVTKDTATNVANYTLDNNLTVSSATLSDDKKVVTLVTTAQTAGTLYKLTIQNVADKAGNATEKKDYFFGGIVDTAKPTATVTVNQNSTVTVLFNEAVNKDLATNVANYTLDNNLTVSKAELASDNKTVTLTTTAQTAGTLYKLTVKAVADKAGNVMDTKDFFFGGIVDTAAPTFTAATTPGTNNKVVLTFNEKLNKDLAQDPTNYQIDGGLNYPTKAVYDDAAKTVTLTTAGQSAGKIYYVTVNNLKDLVGNTIAANSKQPFSGVSTATSQLTLQAVVAVDQNTIDLHFDKEVTAAERDAVTVAVYQGSSATGTPMGIAPVSKVIKSENKKIVRVYYPVGVANTAATNFNGGNVYTAVVNGPATLATADSKNVKTFAGTAALNDPAYVTAIVPVDSTSIKVLFNKPVRNVNASNFTIVDTSASNANISVTGIQGTAPLNDVQEVILNLAGSADPANATATTKLLGGHVYKATFSAGITDPAGVPLKTTVSATDSSLYAVNFGGSDTVNAAPKMQAAVAKDKYNFDIIFTEAVVNTGANWNNYFTITNVTDGGTVSVTDAVYTLDGNKLTVSLDKNSASLAAGKVYKVTYNAGNAITDKAGRVYDTATGANEVQLGGSDAANDVPFVVAVDAVASTGVVTLTFNEDLYETVHTDNFEVKVDGATISVTGVAVSGKTVTLNTGTAFVAGKTGTIGIKTGSGLFTDINGQTPKTDTTATFGTR